MPPKNKKGATPKQAPPASSAPSATTVRRETCFAAVAAQLREGGPVAGTQKEWEDYVRLREAVDALRSAESEDALSTSRVEGTSGAIDWDAQFAAFTKWLEAKSLPSHALEFGRFEGQGNGVRAARDVKKGELVVSVPQSLMMSTVTAASSPGLSALIRTDPVLQGMPNVALAVHLLVEAKKGKDSAWAPYIDTLPRSFGLPLFFTVAELSELKGSPVRLEAMRLFWNVARQYVHLRPLLTRASDGKPALIDPKRLSYDDYAWAVASVMTRQNRIPVGGSDERPEFGLALIPVWDLCNHTTEGEITSVFNAATRSLECTAVRDFGKGEQVLIFYGPRPNSELLMSSGFVVPNNPHDSLAIRVGLSKDDPLAERKQKLLQTLDMTALCDFILRPTGACPSSLACFLRVFCATESELAATTALRVGTLGDMGAAISAENERKAISMLTVRCTLLLRAYPTSIEDDERLLQDGALSPNVRSAVQLRLGEKKILRATMEWLSKRDVGTA